jgi:hypothetical protein
VKEEFKKLLESKEGDQLLEQMAELSLQEKGGERNLLTDFVSLLNSKKQHNQPQ